MSLDREASGPLQITLREGGPDSPIVAELVIHRGFRLVVGAQGAQVLRIRGVDEEAATDGAQPAG